MARLGRLRRLVALVALAAAVGTSATAQQLQLELAATEVALDDVVAAVVRLVGPPTVDITQPVLRSSGFVAQRLAPTQGRRTPNGRQWRFLLVPVEVGPTRIDVTLDHTGSELRASAEATVTGRAASEPTPSSVSDDVTGRRFVTATVDNATAYLHEQITYRFRYYFENWLPTGESPQYGLPSFGGFASRPAGQLPADEGARVHIDGRDYFVEEIDIALFPIVSGPLDIGKTRLVLPRVVDGARDLRTDAISVQVKPLPTPAPSDFSGGVGEYTITAAVADEGAQVGQGVRFTLLVSGRGDLDTLTDIPSPTSSDGEVYGGSIHTDADVVHGHVGGTRVFEYVLVPREAGSATVAFPAISTFSPARSAYVRADAVEISVAVSPAAARPEPPTPAPGARFARPAAAAGGVAVLALLVALGVKRRRASGVPIARRAAGAAGPQGAIDALSAMQVGDGAQVCREIDEAIRGCLAPILGVAPGKVAAALEGVETAGAAMAREVLDGCAEGLYTPSPPDADTQDALRRRAIHAVKLMAGIE